MKILCCCIVILKWIAEDGISAKFETFFQHYILDKLC